MQVQKPKHNQYDNIFEIRQTIVEKQVMDFLSEIQYRTVDAWGRKVTQIGGARIYRDIKDFIHVVLSTSGKLPIWKVVIPRLDGHTGAIYYVAEGKEYNRIFRGTYGYGGGGPHESALIEACFERFGLRFEVRDGDYLINFLYPKEDY